MMMSRHFGSYQQSKISVAQRKGQYSAVQSSQLSWAGQYKKCVWYNFQFTLEYSDVLLSKICVFCDCTHLIRKVYQYQPSIARVVQSHTVFGIFVPMTTGNETMCKYL